MTSQDVQSVLLLGEEKTIPLPLNCHAQEVVKGAEVFHGELLFQSINDSVKDMLRGCCENNVVDI
jgi:hypothetical protein